ncbi:MAG: hypothetical protein COV48_03640, partial [Elusimicrobia bacterium CG11_big_fil_rev_8_21_14_0_20_64_6]
MFFFTLTLLGYFKSNRESQELRLKRKLGTPRDFSEIPTIERRTSRLPFESFRQWLSQSGIEILPAVFFMGAGTLGIVVYTVLAAGLQL